MTADNSGIRPAGGDYRRKILTLEALLPIVADARRQGRTVVQCHGCFDIVHPGHVRYLQFARRQGDLLIVSITGDAAIDKGELRPYIPQELRAENLAALEQVDYVVIDHAASACRLLAAIRPDVYVKGQEYATSRHAGFLAERETVDSYGGRVVFSSGDVVFSSTRLLESIGSDAALDRQRLASVCARHAINSEHLAGLLSAMERQRILILGDCFIDRYVLCEAESIASEAPILSLRELDERDQLGGAAAVALRAAELGASPYLVTTLGADGRSEWARHQLEAAGVECFVLTSRRRTGLRTRYIVDDHKTFRVDAIDREPLDSLGERQVADFLLDQARRADVAVVFGCGHGTLTPGLLQRLGTQFRQRCPMLVGAAGDRRAELGALRHLSLCVASERLLRHVQAEPGAGLSSVAYRFLSDTQSHRLLVTLGKRGVVTFDRASPDPASPEWDDRLRSEYLPALAEHARDTVGCSETVAAVAALGTAVGGTLMQTAYLASAAAAIQVASVGHATVGRSRMAAWLARRGEILRDDREADEPATSQPLEV